MSRPTSFAVQGKTRAARPLHYRICGLDDVYLLNGFTVHKTRYGTGVSIDNVDELHRAIGLFLINGRKPLGPKDVRFLRKQVDLTQGELARFLGVTSQTVARYEKGETEIPGPVDKLLRLLFAREVLPSAKRGRALEGLLSTRDDMATNVTAEQRVYFSPNARGKWETRLAA